MGQRLSIKDRIKRAPVLGSLWPFARQFYYKLKRGLEFVRLRARRPEEIFTQYYHDNKWNGKESVSGTGSGFVQTAVIAAELPRVLEKIGAKSLLDIPCGDFYWMRHVDLHQLEYIGADIVGDLVQQNQGRYGSNNIRFTRLDIIRDELPLVDLIFCRDCLVHLSYRDITSALSNIRSSGAKWLLTTTFPDLARNSDIATGQWRELNLNGEPFNLPQPEEVILEKSTERPGFISDKSMALWRLDDLDFGKEG